MVIVAPAVVKHPCDRVWETLKNARGKVVLSQADRQALLAYRTETSRCWILLRKREAQVQHFRSLAAYPRPSNDREFEAFNEHFGPRPGAAYDQVQAQMFHMAQGANLCRMLIAECRELSVQAGQALAQTEQRNSATAPADGAPERHHQEWRTKLLREMQEMRRTLGGARDALRRLVADAARKAAEAEEQRLALDEQREARSRLMEQLCEARAELAVARRSAARTEEADGALRRLVAGARSLGVWPPAKDSGGSSNSNEPSHDEVVAAMLERVVQLRAEVDRVTAQLALCDERAASAEARLQHTDVVLGVATSCPVMAAPPAEVKAEKVAAAAASAPAASRPAAGQNMEKEILTYIAKKTQSGWPQIFADLMTDEGIDIAEVVRLRSEILYSFGDYKIGQAYAALKRWRRATGTRINYEKLKAALLRNRRKDLADYVEKKAV